MTVPDFDRIADELYTLAPADFTTARNRHADELRKADQQLAKRIRALHRPTQAAWAANLLAHRHPDLVGELLDLGRALRDAQEHLAGERLRELVEQRRRLVRALTARAVQDTAAAGHPLGTGAVADLDGTLNAALADPDAADALATGRLTTAVQPVAWPGAPEAPGRSPGTEAAPSPSERRSRSAPRAGEVPSSKAAAGARAAAAAERQRLREVERAQEELAGAEQARASAAGQAAAAERALEEAEAGQREAEAEAERARTALEKARRLDARAQEDVDRAGQRVRAARKTAHGAGEEAERAREAARDAADRVRDLKHRGDRPEQD
ncbi:hypothetical protein [Kitasatospora purpeofusca]|uniref:hypothetical protein n=1 Tax=Kitasatospora purpeofusca TaxID=67352 RepID=UPI002254B569|nr:hypothetical protein [Kitasatospora purpeofusca]MCX4682724.1 hypothetical protein [Kitasatospora purpeofusca]MCX4690612.1 hypothetical protein [Kitasatospora purpeofusca]